MMSRYAETNLLLGFWMQCYAPPAVCTYSHASQIKGSRCQGFIWRFRNKSFPEMQGYVPSAVCTCSSASASAGDRLL